jgi:hypothetical protein
VHHEFAGLAAIEPPIGDESQYLVSNQISGYLVNQVVKKLAVKNIVPGQWKTLEGADGKRVMTGLVDLLEKTQVSDCNVKVERHDDQPSHNCSFIMNYADVIVTSKNNPELNSIYFSNDGFDCKDPANYQNPGSHLLLQDGNPVVIRHWFDRTFGGIKVGSANIQYTLDPTESKIVKFEVVATQADQGTFVHPITDGPELPWYSFSCTPTP